VKTNRRDAVSLAKLLRAGELTAVWVPDRHHEAMRDLTRARDTAVDDLRSKRQQISAFLLRKGQHYCAGKKTWSQAHLNWLMSQKACCFLRPAYRTSDDFNCTLEEDLTLVGIGAGRDGCR
jgi:transposase